MTADLAKDLHISPVHHPKNGDQTQIAKGKEDIFLLEYREKEKERTKVCFLSGKEREILKGGHSRFDCEYSKEVIPVGPGSYRTEDTTSAFHHTFNKVTSKAGYGGLASRAPRFVDKRPDTLPSFLVTPFHKKCLVHVPKTRVGKCPKPPPPFGSAVPRRTGVLDPKEDTPGFYYDVMQAFGRRQMPFDHSFGGRTHLRPHVLWKCTPDNTDVCSACDRKPQGDYYFSGNHYLCRSCYDKEWNRPFKYTRKMLDTFKKIRDCTDIHRHEGTTAAYPLMSDKDIRKLRILECYFACYEEQELLSFIELTLWRLFTRPFRDRLWWPESLITGLSRDDNILY